MARTEDKVMKKVAPVVQGAVLFNPIISLTNDVKVLASDEDIYENEAIGLDKRVSMIDIATLGAGCKVIKTTERIGKWAKTTGLFTTAYSVYYTIKGGLKNEK